MALDVNVQSCMTCSGSGRAYLGGDLNETQAQKTDICPTCQGTGQVRVPTRRH